MSSPAGGPAPGVVFLAGALTGGPIYESGIEAQFIHGLAPLSFAEKHQGAVLQQVAFRQPDLLPVYGGVELDTADVYHANELFRAYPSGFTLFPLGQAGTGALIFLQKLAAAGRAVAGRKVAVLLAPPAFFRPAADAAGYAANFAPLQAFALAFSRELRFAVKQAAARRMLAYPQTLQGQPLLRFTLQRLAGGGALDRALYAAAQPVGRQRIAALVRRDRRATTAYIEAHPQIRPDVVRSPGAVNWPAVLARATRATEQNATNPFGFENARWKAWNRDATPPREGSRSDEDFLPALGESAEWTDLDLLLDGLHDLSAHPLLLSAPIHGVYYDYLGVSEQARQAFYDRLQQVAGSHNVPVLTFADHDMDKFFVRDETSQLSSKGWVYFARALDAFYQAPYAATPPAYDIAVVPLAEEPARAFEDVPVGPLAADYDGRLEVVNCAFIRGWAWHKYEPDSVVNVDVYDGETLLGSVPAEAFRQDLLDAGKGNGRHAFAFPVPPALKDGEPHEITVRIGGTAIPLPPGAKSLTCPAPKPEPAAAPAGPPANAEPGAQVA